MVPISYQCEDAFHSYSCCFGLGLDLYSHEGSVDSDHSEPVLVVDCNFMVDTDTEVVNTE